MTCVIKPLFILHHHYFYLSKNNVRSAHFHFSQKFYFFINFFIFYFSQDFLLNSEEKFEFVILILNLLNALIWHIINLLILRFSHSWKFRFPHHIFQLFNITKVYLSIKIIINQFIYFLLISKLENSQLVISCKHLVFRYT